MDNPVSKPPPKPTVPTSAPVQPPVIKEYTLLPGLDEFMLSQWA